jgi:hypothetical protein
MRRKVVSSALAMSSAPFSPSHDVGKTFSLRGCSVLSQLTMLSAISSRLCGSRITLTSLSMTSSSKAWWRPSAVSVSSSAAADCDRSTLSSAASNAFFMKGRMRSSSVMSGRCPAA